MPFAHKPAMHRRLERILRLLGAERANSLPLAFKDNRVVLFPGGEPFFRALFAAIRSARRTVLLEYYLIRDDRTGNEFAETLASAVARGVRVLLIYDYIGSIDTPSSYFRRLSQCGVELLAFNVPSFKRGIHWFDRRDHRKMTIIDGTLAFLGGFNIGDEYAGRGEAGRCFHDVGFSLAGSAITELETIFAETWEMELGVRPPLPTPYSTNTARSFPHGKSGVIVVSGGPHHRLSYIRSAFRFSIALASEEILIANPYFVPGPRIVRSMLRAARRRVRIRLLLPAKSDVPLVQLVSRGYYGTLLSAGIEIYEFEGDILHAKLMLIDGERTILGSANLDQRSFHRNFEINGIILNREFGTQIRAMLEQDFENSRRIYLKSHEQRSIITRILEKLVRPLGWFL